MKVDREEMIQVLTSVEPGLTQNEQVEQSDTFVFSEGRVFTYNDTVAVSAKTGLPESVKGAVLAGELFKLMRRYKAVEIDLETDEKEFRVSTKRSMAGIVMHQKITMPLEELGKPKKWLKLPTEEFCAGIKFCLFSVSSDLTKPVLTCIHISGHFVESSDNFRITRYKMKENACKKSLLIPAKAAAQLLKYKPTAFSRTSGWLHFKCPGDVIFSCRVFDTKYKYPDLDPMLKVKGVSIKFPASLRSALDRASVFTKQKLIQDEVVSIRCSKGKVTVEARGESGWIRETKTLKGYKGNPVAFSINPHFFFDTLGLFTEVVVGKVRVMLKGSNFVHAVQLAVEYKSKAEKKG